MNSSSPSPRPRNAAATRTAILEAAQDLFACKSYDDVGMRDIARHVGVDAALISRYFGCKDELFQAALNACSETSTLMTGEKKDFGRRVAQEILMSPKRADELKGLSMVLQSIGSAKAAEIVQRTSKDHFFKPLEDWLGGPDAAVRSRLLASTLMGISVSRELGSTGSDLTEAQRLRLQELLARMLQDLVDN